MMNSFVQNAQDVVGMSRCCQ